MRPDFTTIFKQLVFAPGVLGAALVLVAALSSRPATALLLPVQIAQTGGREFVLSPNGRHLYVAANERWLSVFARDASTGALRFSEALFAPDDGSWSFEGAGLVISPDGRHLYAGARIGHALVVLSRDPTTGSLGVIDAVADTEPGAVDLHGSAGILSVSPDGANVYAASLGSGPLVVFRRESVSGRLAHVQSVELNGHVKGIAGSEDGNTVYVVRRGFDGDDDALLVLRRDPRTGILTLVDEERDGAGGYVALAEMASVVVSMDGRHVYVGTTDAEVELLAFVRRGDTGALTLLQVLRRDPGAPYRGTYDLAISADGTTVYAAGSDELTAYRRDIGSGTVSPVAELRHGAGLPALSSLQDLAISFDPPHIYALGYNGLIVLRRLCGDGALDPAESCDDGNTGDGDGCNSACGVEQCFRCAGVPSACAAIDGHACDDGNACTTGEACGAGACSGGAPVADGARCDDGDACTLDDMCVAGECRPAGPKTCGACEDCDRFHGCVGAPHTGCLRSPIPDIGRPGGPLVVQRRTGRGLARWAWLTNRRVKARDYPDPADGTTYSFCVFDSRGLPDGARRRRNVVLGAEIPGDARCGQRSCWRRQPDGGLRFQSRRSDVRGLVLKPAGAGSTAIRLTAGGRSVLADPLPLEGPVTVQLRTDTGACWEANFAAFVRRNDAAVFRARAGVEPPCGPSPSCGGH